jgi:hypothetical protein
MSSILELLFIERASLSDPSQAQQWLVYGMGRGLYRHLTVLPRADRA